MLKYDWSGLLFTVWSAMILKSCDYAVIKTFVNSKGWIKGHGDFICTLSAYVTS